ncbi:efflux RND transporter periplasmic adaptor subunit [Singulisphaera acidiphila]|uniref:RND family efflux transporter, MFP subunit n=1 Tax=Singulisphaera acidiphila (strain ATCC BAA-1392 / DSM 18658 / VKM B-2454 / MOB10) TaxID=886293 RepID=L0DRA3_SINAD|nr:efflux RND transporter periplasmic adaptor subunit [Singulisphaera acidiphila]AGA31507.1 RND family efflux transporter, MFP subunit [Singulisphaera acidiphila DSM 18658]
MYRPALVLGVTGLWLATVAGCQRHPTAVAPPQPPVIPVSRPVEREVTEYADFTGQTDAVQAVDIRPRVTGYLVKMLFKEGADVKAGDTLFVIDPRPYKAQLDQAEGQVNLYQAQLKLAKIVFARDQAINLRVANSISQEHLEQDLAAVEEADARVKAFEKNMEAYKLNHDFTKVISPIDGHVSRYYLTLGNLVNQDQTLLTTVVSQDPMYAYFDVDEPTLLRLRRAINQGKLNPPKPGVDLPVLMGLQGEDGFPHQGVLNFVDNQVNPTTGSISVRGVFPNPKPPGGIQLLSPGMFVRIRLPIGKPHLALLVIDRAIASDQGLKYVYVVDTKNNVQYRRVTTGPLQENGLRVITQGLERDEWVVVGGLQQVNPRMHVQPERIPMPLLGQPTEENTPTTKPGGPTTHPADQTKTPKTASPSEEE